VVEHACTPGALDPFAAPPESRRRLALQITALTDVNASSSPLERDVDQPERVGRVQTIAVARTRRSRAGARALQPAERQRERADILDARRRGPELEEAPNGRANATRSAEVDAASLRPARSSAAGPPVLRRLEHPKLLADCPLVRCRWV